MLKKLKIMQSVFALYIIWQAAALLSLFLWSSVSYAQSDDPTSIQIEIRVLPEGMLKEISLPVMVRIPKGQFTMGEDNNDGTADPNEPAHKVTIDYNFEVSQYEITRGEFRHFAENADSTDFANYTGISVCQGKDITAEGDVADSTLRWDNLAFRDCQ